MLAKLFSRKKNGRPRGSLSYVEKDPTCLFLDMATEDWVKFRAANPFTVKENTGSLNFKEQLTEHQAIFEWRLFRSLFIDPYGVSAWSRLHPKENKSNKLEPHSAIHFGVGTRLPDGRQITIFFGCNRPKGRDFAAIDAFKKWRNAEMAYASPDDPTLWKRQTKIQRNWSRTCKNFVEQLNEEIPKLSFRDDRAALIEWLCKEKSLTVSRIGKDYVTIKAVSWKCPIRLQGPWWSAEPIAQNITKDQASPEELYKRLIVALRERHANFEKRFHFSKHPNRDIYDFSIFDNLPKLYTRIRSAERKLLDRNSKASSGNPTVQTGTPSARATIEAIARSIERRSRSLRPHSHDHEYAGALKLPSSQSGSPTDPNRADLEEFRIAWEPIGKGIERVLKVKFESEENQKTLIQQNPDLYKMTVGQLMTEVEAARPSKRPNDQDIRESPAIDEKKKTSEMDEV